MAEFTMKMTDEQAASVTEAYCQQYGYTGAPEGAAEFAQGVIKGFIMQVVKNHKMHVAREEAEAKADVAVKAVFDTENAITIEAKV